MQQDTPKKLKKLFCGGANVRKSFVINATNLLFMDGFCVDKVESCTIVRQTFGRSPAMGVITNRNWNLETGLWTESYTRRRSFYGGFICQLK